MKIENCLDAISRDAAWMWIVRRFLLSAGLLGPCCPSCGARITSEKALRSFFGLRRTYCKSCDKVFTPTAGTPIHETSWVPEEFWELMILHLAGRRPVEIAQHLGKSAGTVREMLDKVELCRSAEQHPLGSSLTT